MVGLIWIRTMLSRLTHVLRLNRIFYILKPLVKHDTYRHLVCWDNVLISVFKCLSERLFSLCFRLSAEVPGLTFGVVILCTPATVFSLENATFTHFWCQGSR